MPIFLILNGIFHGHSGPVSGSEGKEGEKRVLAIRADMDCLPITETSGVPYASTVVGNAHSCGHDGHVASALGTALLLHARRDKLPANFAVRYALPSWPNFRHCCRFYGNYVCI